MMANNKYIYDIANGNDCYCIWWRSKESLKSIHAKYLAKYFPTVFKILYDIFQHLAHSHIV